MHSILYEQLREHNETRQQQQNHRIEATNNSISKQTGVRCNDRSASKW